MPAGRLPAVRAVYFPPYALNRRLIEIYVHQSRQLGLNAVVLHLKDPRGRIFWPSKVPGAGNHVAAGAAINISRLVKTLKDNYIWTIAKLDVFADHCLVRDCPWLGVQDTRTGRPWKDKNGLFWANPYDRRVWDYVVNLAKELAACGFDEIQFDYVRFPSDGDLSRIAYPGQRTGVTRSRCIASFLKYASQQLRPLGVKLAAAVFGLIAWKKHDFGVGQVLEEMAPHLDVICPMFYPSHFPAGFLGKERPSLHPGSIMLLSTRRIRQRTTIPVRPWIQDFWYGPAEVEAQLEALEKAKSDGWSAWNPSGRYKATYTALARRQNVRLVVPKLYPGLDELRSLPDNLVSAASKPVNLTSYRKGFSVISLQPTVPQSRVRASTPAGLSMTFDESILDRILTRRGVPFGMRTTKRVKASLVAGLMCRDLGVDSRRMQPRKIFIDWSKDCRFTYEVPAWAASAFRPPGPAGMLRAMAGDQVLRDDPVKTSFFAD